VPQPAGAFHRPGPLRPGRRPLQQPLRLTSRGSYPHLAKRPFIRAGRYRRVQALMRARTDHHYRHDLPLPSLFGRRGPWRACLIPGRPRRTSFEPRHGKARQADTSFGSQAGQAGRQRI